MILLLTILVEGENNEEFGANLGEEFKNSAQARWKKELAMPDWQSRLNYALSLLPQTEKYSPNYIRELQAYAKATGIPFKDLWTISLEQEVGDDENDHCTSMVTNNGNLIGHNEDFEPGAQDHISILRSRIGNLIRFELFYEHTLGGSGITVNSNGFVHVVNTLSHRRRRPGVPKHVITRFLSETENPIHDLAHVKMLKRHAGYSHTFINKKGHILNAEFSAANARLGFRLAPWVRTNHYLSKSMENEEIGEHRYDSAMRLATAQKRLRPIMTTEELKEFF